MFVARDIFSSTNYQCNNACCSNNDYLHNRRERRQKQCKKRRRSYQYKAAYVMSYIIVLALFHSKEIVSHAFSYTSLPQSLRFNSQIPRLSKYHLLFMSQQSINNDSTTTTPNNTVKNPAATPTTSTNEYSFFDEATIYIRAGSGGQGSSTYKKGVNSQNGPPDGGNGGKGGNVILQVDESLNTLAGLARYAWRPNSFGGGGGGPKRHAGGDARTLRLRTARLPTALCTAQYGRQRRGL